MSQWPTSLCIGDLLIDFVPTVTGTAWPTRRPSARRRAEPRPTSPWAWPGWASAAPSWARSATTRSAISWPTTLRREGVDVAPLRFEPRPHGAGLRLAARRRRARVPVLPPPQRRHAVHRGRRRPRRDRGGQGAALRLDQPGRREPAGHVPVRRRPRRGAGKLVSYDVNLRLPLWPDAEAAKAGIRPGSAGPRSSSSATTSSIPDRRARPGAACAASGTTGLRRPDPDPRQRRLDLVYAQDRSGEVPSFRSRPSTPPAPATASWPGLLAGLLATPAPEDARGLTAICRFANAVGPSRRPSAAAIPALPTAPRSIPPNSAPKPRRWRR